MKKIMIIAAIIAAIAILAGGGVFGYSRWAEAKEDKLLSSNSQTKDAYAVVKMRREQIKKDKNNYDAYMSLAFYWKGIGEVMRNDKYLWRAAKTYDAVISKWGNKAYLPFYNQANVYIDLKEYARAEENLKISLEIDRGEQNLYVALAELYQNYMKKSDADIRAVYEKGLKTLIGGGNLVLNYAVYLNDTGDYKEALKYYKMLEQAYPDNTLYPPIVENLEAKVAES